MSDQIAGWYPDPEGDLAKLRYWDGSQWTNDYTAAPAAQPEIETPAVAAAPAEAPAEAVVEEPAPADVPAQVPVEPTPADAPAAEPVFETPAVIPAQQASISSPAQGFAAATPVQSTPAQGFATAGQPIPAQPAPNQPFATGPIASSPAYQPQPQVAQPAQQGGKGLVIAGLILGIISILSFWFPPVGVLAGIAALVFGIIGLVKKSGGMAIASLILGAVGLAISVIILVASVWVVNNYSDIISSANNYNSSNSSSNNSSNSSSNNSSSSGAAIDSSKLVGTWEEVDIDNTYVFNADGSGTESYNGNTKQMTWRIDGNHLYLDFPDTGKEDYDIEFQGGTLVVHNPLVDYEYTKR